MSSKKARGACAVGRPAGTHQVRQRAVRQSGGRPGKALLDRAKTPALRPSSPGQFLVSASNIPCFLSARELPSNSLIKLCDKAASDAPKARIVKNTLLNSLFSGKSLADFVGLVAVISRSTLGNSAFIPRHVLHVVSGERCRQKESRRRTMQDWLSIAPWRCGPASRWARFASPTLRASSCGRASLVSDPK
jgi:hypothetical protein